MTFFNTSLNWGFPFNFNALSYGAGYLFGNSLLNAFIPKPQINYPQFNLSNSNWFESSLFAPQMNFSNLFNSSPQFQINTCCQLSNFDTFESYDKCNCSNWSTFPMYTPQYTWGNSLNTSVESNTFSKTKESHKGTSGTSKHWTKLTDAEMLSIYGNYTRSIEKTKTHTPEELNKYLNTLPSGSVLKGKGKAFADAENKYGIDAVSLIAICMNESAKGTSNIAKNKNNVSSISTGKSGAERWKKFNSVEECIDYTAKLLRENYVHNSGLAGVHLTKLYQVNSKYCPVAETGNNSSWAKNVECYAKKIDAAIA